MKPYGRSKRYTSVDRFLLEGEWVDLGEGFCTSCHEARRVYTSVRLVMAPMLYRLMCFLLGLGARATGLPTVEVCSDCSQVYNCISYDDSTREVEDDEEMFRRSA